MSRGEDGIVRVDHEAEGALISETFEAAAGGVLHSSFNSNGELLDQRLLRGAANADKRAEDFVSGLRSEALPTDYSAIRLQKRCSKCGAPQLERDTSGLDSDVRVVPVYVCGSCKARHFHLGDAYLSKLVKSNKALFSESEVAAFEKEPEIFMEELKEHIIRIFASKRIMKAQ